MTLVTLFIALLPGFAWLFFYLQEDPHPEPKRLIAITFIFGALAALVAFAAQTFLIPFLTAVDIRPLTIPSLLVLALIEEVAKFGAAYLAVHKREEFDEPVDAMIYMVVAALGFATLENIGAVSGGRQLALVSDAFETASFRFVGATLLHTLTSALVGYYWALTIRAWGAKKYLVIGLLAALVLHAAFNYLILNFGNLMYTLVFVIVVGFFALGDFEKLKRNIV